MIVDHTDQLVDQKGVAMRVFVPSTRTVGEPLAQHVAPLFECIFQRRHDGAATRWGALGLDDGGNAGGQRAPVDNFSLLGDAGQSHRQANKRAGRAMQSSSGPLPGRKLALASDARL